MEKEKIERQREHFNQIADLYEQGRQEITHKRIKELIWTEVTKKLSPWCNKELRVLEPMCGFAEGKNIIENHISPNIIYEGFDYSDHIVNRLKDEHPQLKIWQGDVTNYQAKPNHIYDVIIIIGGLHHVPNHAEAVLKSLSKALAPNGIFINFEPTHGNPIVKWVREFIYSKNSIFDEETERAFSVFELESFFQKTGLKKHYQFYPGLLSYVLYYNPYAFPFLNKGGTLGVDLAFGLDRIFMHNFLGRFLSFATLTIWVHL